MQLTPSDIYLHFKPSECDLRIYLNHQAIQPAEPSPYSEVLKRLGKRHELAHLATLGVFEDLSQSADEQTKAAVSAGASVIYQPLLKCTVRIAGIDCEVRGRPDFLIKDNLGYRIRDSKISRRITEKDHPEIILQLQTYGWLFERMFGVPASALEVHSGPGEIVEVPYAGPEPVMNALREIVRIKSLTEEPYAPVGFTRCGDCGYHDRCWERAEANREVALVRGLDKDIALTLHERNILTMDQLLSEFDEASLAELERKRGDKSVRVGAAATSILRNAKALASGEEILLSKPEIPESKNYVMFDLEGLPPQFDDLQKVYLWGMQVFGETTSDYICSTAGFGSPSTDSATASVSATSLDHRCSSPTVREGFVREGSDDGDREGWEGFLTAAQQIFDTYGEIPFVHWATYEATLIDAYLKRYGDDTGRAARVQKNLLNLLPVTEESIVLPIPSYSLKEIEKYIGFKRTQDEYGGNWSMAQYIEAMETADAARREEVMSTIRTYNREDLEATWSVMQWLMKKTG